MAGRFDLCWTHLKFGTRHAGTPAETGWLVAIWRRGTSGNKKQVGAANFLHAPSGEGLNTQNGTAFQMFLGSSVWISMNFPQTSVVAIVIKQGPPKQIERSESFLLNVRWWRSPLSDTAGWIHRDRWSYYVGYRYPTIIWIHETQYLLGDVGGDWNMADDFPFRSFSWEFHHPNWRTHMFQRGRAQPPTRLISNGCWWNPKNKSPDSSQIYPTLMVKWVNYEVTLVWYNIIIYIIIL